MQLKRLTHAHEIYLKKAKYPHTTISFEVYPSFFFAEKQQQKTTKERYSRDNNVSFWRHICNINRETLYCINVFRLFR